MKIDGEATRNLYINLVYTFYVLGLVSNETYDEVFHVIWLSTFR